MRVYKVNHPMELYKAQVTPRAEKSTAKGKDQLSVSKTAKEFQIAYKSLKDVPEVRKEKIDSIKERIQSGTYDVSTKEVSEKIMSQLDLRG